MSERSRKDERGEQPFAVSRARRAYRAQSDVSRAVRAEPISRVVVQPAKLPCGAFCVAEQLAQFSVEIGRVFLEDVKIGFAAAVSLRVRQKRDPVLSALLVEKAYMFGKTRRDEQIFGRDREIAVENTVGQKRAYRRVFACQAGISAP